MPTYARVESVDALKAFRVALIKYAEACNTALGDAEGELGRMGIWLEHEQLSYWEGQVRKRTELVSRAKDAVRQKKLYKDSTGKPQSAVDEEKALQIAQRRLLEAEEKLASTRRSIRLLQKEVHQYKGTVQRFTTTIQSDVPLATARLDRMVAALEAYLALHGETAGGGGGASAEDLAALGGVITEAMSRPEADAAPDKKEAEQS